MIDKTEIKKRLANLSTAQRAQLAERLATPGVVTPVTTISPLAKAKPLREETECLKDGSSYRVTIYPASHSQQQMWFLHAYVEGRPVYNIPSAFHLKGHVDQQAMATAFSALVRRHDTLRTTFSVQEGELVQRVSSRVVVPWKELNLEEMPAEKRIDIAEKSLEEEAVQPFNLTESPAFRVMLLCIQPDEYFLLVTLHHIISDGWSRSNLWRELAELYGMSIAVTKSQLIPLPLQFADYSTWHAQWLEAGEFNKHADFWKSNLSGDLEPLELPFDRPRLPRESFRGDRARLKLDQSLVLTLTEHAHKAGSTFFMILLAAFNTLLYRYTGCEDLIVGVPVANRPRLELEPLIGYFVNTLVFRTSLAGQPTFLELLGRVKEISIAALEHQAMPFEKLVDILKIPRDASHTPIFQTSFALRDFPDVEFSVPGLKAEQWDVSTGTAKFDLSLTVERSGNDWVTVVEFSTDLFDLERVDRLLGHWQKLLESVAEDPSRKLSDLEMLTEQERQQILVEWNNTATDYPRKKCVHQLFEEQAAQTPDAVAVVFADESLTYHELDQRANRLAEHLRSLGVGPGNLVAMCIERSLEMIIGILGIIKAGGAYWALEDNLPHERFCWMLADAKPGVLLTRTESLAKIREIVKSSPDQSVSDSLCIVAIEDPAIPAAEKTPDSEVLSSPDDPVYVNYTSGSTGQPKAVVVKHRGVVRLVKGVDYAALSPEETFLHLSPLSFDASTFEIWGALLNGGRVVLMPPGPPALMEIGETIRRHQVSTVFLTAGLFHLMVEEKVNDLKPLRQLFAGGDVLSPKLMAVARRALPDCRIISVYGPTENTTFTSFHTVKADDELTRTVPIGRPISNTSVYILDSACKPVPVGVPGELYTGGDGVAIGYLNQPELTAERFIPDPFSRRDGDRLYRTGDRARWCSDGNLEFMGRLDSQVKIRGFRVEMGEIEAVLRDLPEIQEAKAFVDEDSAGEKRIIACIVPRTANRIESSLMRSKLAEKLPEYMLPHSFLWVDRLPLMANGKVDVKALQRTESAEEFPAHSQRPINLLELELIRIWQKLLGQENIGRHDNFFALGGHSLLAARMAIQVEEKIGCKLPVAALFQSPTIELLARRFSDEKWSPPWSSLVPLQPEGSRPPLFFVHGWGGDVYSFLDLTRLLSPDQPCYGIQALGLDGRCARHQTIEEMARYYVKEMISLQPEGPYYLAGYSLGGLIAFEVARQIHLLGRRVAQLFILDSGIIGPAPRPFYLHSMLNFFYKRFLFHGQRCLKMPVSERINYFRGRCAAFKNWLYGKNRQNAVMYTDAAATTTGAANSVLEDYYVTLCRRHRLMPYSGPAVIFEGNSAAPRWRLYWRHLARGGVSFVPLAVHHHGILSGDYLPEFARIFSAELVRAQKNEKKIS